MKKRIFGTVAAVIALSSMSAMATPTFAASSKHTMVKKSFVLNGKSVTSPYGFVANDGGTPTSYMPIWYLEQVLKQLGITDSWDGHSWKLTLPQGSTPDLSNLSVGKGNTAIYVNGTLVSAPNSIVDVDPSSGNATTFMPLWYLQQVLHRIGVQDSWNGTSWTLTGTAGTPANAATKDQVVSTFATALGVTTDKISVPSSVGVAFTLSDVDRMYWDYVGISDANASSQPGGNVSAWANTIGLNRGLSASGFITTDQLTQLSANLSALKSGYYKDSSGVYHVLLPVKDEYTAIFKTAVSPSGQAYWTTTSDRQAITKEEYAFFNSTTFTIDGDNMVVSIPTFSMSSSYFMALVCDPSTPLDVSYDGGKTWKSFSTYVSYDPSRGGQNNVTKIMFRVPASKGFGAGLSSFVDSIHGIGAIANINVRVDSNGNLVVVRN